MFDIIHSLDLCFFKFEQGWLLAKVDIKLTITFFKLIKNALKSYHLKERSTSAILNAISFSVISHIKIFGLSLSKGKT